jgi:predicted alternative tryptophan synthase beta-subunit
LRNRKEFGRKILADDPATPGSLGIAITEAIQEVVQDEDTRYSLRLVAAEILIKFVSGIWCKAGQSALPNCWLSAYQEAAIVPIASNMNSARLNIN